MEFYLGEMIFCVSIDSNPTHHLFYYHQKQRRKPVVKVSLLSFFARNLIYAYFKLNRIAFRRNGKNPFCQNLKFFRFRKNRSSDDHCFMKIC